MALHTLTTNPAQHFYQRCGFEVVATLVDSEFERVTGAKGNVLMVKRLD
jgi:ribosomal protein S18 acetylase RimI-like enzyme